VKIKVRADCSATLKKKKIIEKKRKMKARRRKDQSKLRKAGKEVK
jgi:hypothetical protein